MRIAVVVVVIVGLLGSPAWGWSEAGHKLVASIAFRRLTADERARVVAVLENHPRFETDFKGKLPADLDSTAARQEWLFQQAAIWPDWVRGYPDDLKAQYHRSFWHYVNYPHFLSAADRTALEPGLRLNLALDPPAAIGEFLNLPQATRAARTLLKDPRASAQQQGLMLAWLFHNVGDSHQPLHSTALFTPTLFPQGDRGGNLVPTEQRNNLHALWDQLPGQFTSFAEARNRAIEFTQDAKYSALGEQAARNLDVAAWLDEGHSAAVTQVYHPEVVAVLRRWEADQQTGKLPPIVLSEAYLKAGGQLCRQRIVQAGYRLGAILKEVAVSPKESH